MRRDALPDGRIVQQVRLAGAEGLELEVSTLGASVTRLTAPDRNGRVESMVLGLAAAADYWGSRNYFGATVGRFANRIAGARLSIGAVSFLLDANEGVNTLHGGRLGFHRAIWTIASFDDSSVRLEHTSPNGDMGFPGALRVAATYRLLRGGGYSVTYEAVSEQVTIVSIANHAYFNLAGEGCGTILAHEVSIAADHYLPVRGDLIPTGDISPVEDTAFDLRSLCRLGEAMDSPHGHLAIAGGFDHNFCLRGDPGCLRAAAIVSEPISGRVLTVRTTAPGLQFYTGQHLDGGEGRHGLAHGKFGGFCMEAQSYPDAPNHSHFPSALLMPGHRYTSLTEYILSTNGSARV